MNRIIVEKVLSIINLAQQISITEEQMDEDLTTLGMDSMAFIQIIVGLEEAFDCEIPDSKLLLSEMNTVRKMIDVILEQCHELVE